MKYLLGLAVMLSTVMAQIPEWEPSVDMGEQLFPSYLIATATLDFSKNFPVVANASKNPFYLGEMNGQIGIKLISPNQPASFDLEIEGTKFVRKSSFSGQFLEPSKKYCVFPLIDYNYDELITNHQPMPETITFRLKMNGQLIGEKKKVIQVRSIGDCLFGVKGIPIDFSFMFASYVNENHPQIDQILKWALDTGIVKNFGGYQGSSDQVRREIAAIWAALQERGFRYTSITTSSAYSDTVYSQNVRFVGESLANSQANCVDGSVLFASIFRKIGLETFLILVPGHCFVGVWTDKEHYSCIETTLLGNMDRKNYLNDKDALSRLLGGLTGVSTKNQASLWAYNQAESVGAVEFKKAHSFLFQNPKTDPRYQVIDIQSARKMGVMPIKEILSSN